MVKRLVESRADCDPENFRTHRLGWRADVCRGRAEGTRSFSGRGWRKSTARAKARWTITYLSKEEIADREQPRWLERLASAGRPYACVEVMVADAEDRALPTGETGEILCRGDVVMAGYWQNAEASAASLKGGWLHTGDVGAFDADGYLTLKDRSKDLIISGGSNIYPREVEEVLLKHSGVREVSVIGRPDANGVRWWWPMWSATPNPPSSTRYVLRKSPASSVRRTMCSSTRCRRTITAKS